ncbi:CGNR zinc finger domain-containing protein [Streptomyces sp. NPDC057638]|uniref:CGNR zinc finger domain-containing protein n=1 Tax=Streptomyces sp. NPDC057638 TaxID=3346190 RepID=UPI003674FDBD
MTRGPEVLDQRAVVLTGPHAHRVRVCAAHDCQLLFADTSRPGRRRWCSMERCGNREKVRAHRARPEDRTGSDSPGPVGAGAVPPSALDLLALLVIERHGFDLGREIRAFR